MTLFIIFWTIQFFTTLAPDFKADGTISYINDVNIIQGLKIAVFSPSLILLYYNNF